MRDKLPLLIVVAIFALMAWGCAAEITFRLRHPWATETEVFLNFWHALKFERVPYEKMRPRE